MIPHPMRRTVAVLLTFALSACATTDQADEVTPSGFLEDTSRLAAGLPGEPLLIWAAPAAEFDGYEEIFVEPIALALDAESLEEIDPEQRVALAESFRAKLQDALDEDFRIVETPGPDTLRVRAALTEAESTCVAMNLATTVSPYGLVASKIVEWSSGCRTFVGSATVEAELIGRGDRPLLQFVDRRRGTKSLSGVFSSWDDVEESFTSWSGQLRDWLRRQKQDDSEARAI